MTTHHTTDTADPSDTGTAGPDSPYVYGWSVDGEPCTGGLARYAQDRAGSFYAGIPIGPLHRITVDPDGGLCVTPVDLRRTATRYGDGLRVHLRADTDTATYRIDLNA